MELEIQEVMLLYVKESIDNIIFIQQQSTLFVCIKEAMAAAVAVADFML